MNSKLRSLVLAISLAAGNTETRAQIAESLTVPEWAKERVGVPRRALVIGISAYDHATQLVTPAYDRKKIAETFTSMHFDTVDIVETDVSGQPADRIHLSREALIAAVQRFRGKVQPGDVVAVYFSGHGVQTSGINYLVPSTGTANPFLPDLEYVSVQWVMSTVLERGPSVEVVFLDACRADPFIGSQPEDRDILADPVPVNPSVITASGGLAFPAADQAYLISFAAQPLKVAYSRFSADKADAESIYTRVLAPNLSSLAPIDYALQQTEKAVKKLSNGALVPNNSRSLVYGLNLDSTSADLPLIEETWARVVNTTEVPEQKSLLSNFVEDFPASSHAIAARARLAQLNSVPPSGNSALTVVAVPTPSAQPALALIGTVRAARSQDGKTLAFVARPTTVRSATGQGKKLGELLAGSQVTMLRLFPAGEAFVQTIDGTFGYIRGVMRATADRIKTSVNLRFGGADEYADVTNWADLIAARAALVTSDAVVTIRGGQNPADTSAASRALSRLRLLRIRDYIRRFGVPERRIVLAPSDPSIAANIATVIIGKAGG